MTASFPFSPLAWLARLAFGRVRFPDNEEYQEFQFKLLCVLLLSGVVFTATFLVGNHLEFNPLHSPHLTTMQWFTALSAVLWWALRGRPHRYLVVAWVFELACLIEYASALALVPSDELRILWLFVNIPCVYLMLGNRAGASITVLSMVALVVANPYLSAPYSGNALATAIVSMVDVAVFFHIYGNRSLSYFHRMRESNLRLQQLASHDPLTGVFNARAYAELCGQRIQLARRTGSPFSVLFVDLDHFKRVNDTYGHAAGDVVLQTVTQTLSRNLRHSDLLGRIGGEEFSIYLSDTPLQGAVQLAEVLRAAVEQCMPESEGKVIPITASIGVAQSHDAQNLQEIQHHADEAMYQAKAQGRNRVSVFDASSAAPKPVLGTAALQTPTLSTPDL